MAASLFDRPLRRIPIWLAVIWCLLVILLAYLGTFPLDILPALKDEDSYGAA